MIPGSGAGFYARAWFCERGGQLCVFVAHGLPASFRYEEFLSGNPFSKADCVILHLRVDLLACFCARALREHGAEPGFTDRPCGLQRRGCGPIWKEQWVVLFFFS